MLRTRETTSIYVLLVTTILAFLAVDRQAAASVSLFGDVCADALRLELESTIQSELDVPVDGIVFYLNLPTAGLLSIEMAIDRAVEEGPHLDFLGLGCDLSHVDRDAVIEQSAYRQMMAFSRPGDYYFQVSGRGPERQRGVQLTMSFAGAVAVERERAFGLTSGLGGVLIRQTDFYPHRVTKNEPEEVDPDPNKSSRREPIVTLLVARAAAFAKNEPEEVDPDPNKRVQLSTVSARLALFPSPVTHVTMKNEPEEVDPDPNKSSRPGGRVVDGLLSVGEAAVGERRRGFLSLRLTDSAFLPGRYDALLEWLAEVLEAENARLRLLAPGTRGNGLRLLDYQPAD